LIWVKCMFYRAHGLYGGAAMFGNEKMFLSLSDSMLAGACPFHSESTNRNTFDESFGAGYLIGVIHHHKDTSVEIAVTHMSNDWRYESCLIDIPLGFNDAFRKPRDWYANIGDNSF